jgi:hypothetical protein
MILQNLHLNKMEISQNFVAFSEYMNFDNWYPTDSYFIYALKIE